MAEAHDVLVRRGVEDEGVDRQQGVEPPSRLIDGFGDEVSREGQRLSGAWSVGVTDLSRGHGPRVKPRIDDWLDPGGGHATLGAVEGHLVDRRAVRVDAADVTAGQGRELLTAGDACQVASLTSPDRQRRPPEAVTRQRPVDIVLKPLTEATVSDVGGMPVDLLVLRHHAVGDL